MNEADTRAEHIDPAMRAAGWGVMPGSRIRREVMISPGRLELGGRRARALIADYVLEYKNRILAVVEAKAFDLPLTEGLGQAKPDDWRDRFDSVPYEDKGGSHPARYYQDTAIQRVMEAIAGGQERILLTLATGTGRTFIAFQIVWKLFNARWNRTKPGSRIPRVLFLADRNILANQAFNAFSAFSDDALVRIKPEEIRRKGGVPKNGSVFFTIFQTFMSGPGETPYFGDYPPRFFRFHHRR